MKLLAAKCGAYYISPFVGRLDYVGQIGMDFVRQTRTIYDNYGEGKDAFLEINHVSVGLGT